MPNHISHLRYRDLTVHQTMRMHYAPELWSSRHDLLERVNWTANCADPGWAENRSYGARPDWSFGALRRGWFKLFSVVTALRMAIGRVTARRRSEGMTTPVAMARR